MSDDVLVSWNEGPAKHAIVDFVKASSTRWPEVTDLTNL